MKIYIRNMVCDRCKLAVSNVMNKLDLKTESIELGEVDFGELELSPEKLEAVRTEVEALGFELIDDKKSRLIESIKNLIIKVVQELEEPKHMKLSEHLSKNLHYDYNYLSNLFSAVEGVTIEQYLIQQKIEKVKELLVYDEINLTEISFQLGYSSVAHLSRQFKKVTGLTPSHFKQLKDVRQRKSLDKI